MYNMSPMRFYVGASLDMPNKLDINKIVRVQVVRLPGTPSQTAQGYMQQAGIPAKPAQPAKNSIS